MRIKTSLVIVALSLCISMFGQTTGNGQTSADISGKWKGEVKNKTLQLEIDPGTDGMYLGKVINDNSTPSKNGVIVLSGLQYDGGAKAYKGTMRPPDEDVQLDATISLADNDRLKLVVKKLFITRTLYLTRIK